MLLVVPIMIYAHLRFCLLSSRFQKKTAPKYASRPGNFHFVCDACLTNFEIKRASSQSDKVDSLTTKVCNLENGLNEIKTLLKN